jgi:hypothetical protein
MSMREARPGKKVENGVRYAIKVVEGVAWMKASPILKWVGGKTGLLSQLDPQGNMAMTAEARKVFKSAAKRAKEPEVRWWIGTSNDPAKRLQIVVSEADAAKHPPHGDTRRFVVTDLLTGKRIRIRRADCGLGCQCALERA